MRVPPWADHPGDGTLIIVKAPPLILMLNAHGYVHDPARDRQVGDDRREIRIRSLAGCVMGVRLTAPTVIRVCGLVGDGVR